MWPFRSFFDSQLASLLALAATAYDQYWILPSRCIQILGRVWQSPPTRISRNAPDKRHVAALTSLRAQGVLEIAGAPAMLHGVPLYAATVTGQLLLRFADLRFREGGLEHIPPRGLVTMKCCMCMSGQLMPTVPGLSDTEPSCHVYHV